MNVGIALNQTVPTVPPQGPPEGQPFPSRAVRRMGGLGSCGRRGGRSRMRGPLDDVAAGVGYTTDANGNLVDANGNIIETAAQIAAANSSGGSGLISQVAAIPGQITTLTTTGLSTLNTVAADVGQGVQTLTNVGTAMLWGGGAILLYMLWKESQTPEGRARFGSQVKNSATGAARVAGSAAKAALL